MLAVTSYTILKFIHVLLAIIAVGFNASYGIWIARAAREPEHELHVLRGIKILDDRFANPGYGLLLVTGLAMVVVGDVPLSQLWLKLALGLYGATALIAIFVYSPTLRRQIKMLEAGTVPPAEYARGPGGAGPSVSSSGCW